MSSHSMQTTVIAPAAICGASQVPGGGPFSTAGKPIPAGQGSVFRVVIRRIHLPDGNA
jgi:hypothetical protein